VGNVDKHYDLVGRIAELSDDQLHSLKDGLASAGGTALASVAKALTDQEIERRGAEDNVAVELIAVEKQEDRRIVFGEVLVPETKDAHGDVIGAEEIERAAHLWLSRFQDRGVQHTKIANSKMELFESYIAPTRLTLGGRKVKKGTWLLMLHVLDDDLWKQVKKGEFTGFSMGGFARKVQAK
jgi:HPt (histidine-containing phosphotransfer) domain-containing protein